MKHLSGKTRRRMLRRFKKEIRDMGIEMAKGPYYPAEKFFETGIIATSYSPILQAPWK